MKKYGNMDEQEVRASLFAGADQKRSLQRVEMLGREKDSIEQSVQMINTYSEMGRASMRSLKDQKQTLKKSHQKALDVLHSLGLSRTLMKLIERKDFHNGCLMFLCMFLTCIIFWGVWYYSRYLPRQPQPIITTSSSSSSSSSVSASGVTISAAPGSGVVFSDSLPVPIQPQRLDPDPGPGGILRQAVAVQS